MSATLQALTNQRRLLAVRVKQQRSCRQIGHRVEISSIAWLLKTIHVLACISTHTCTSQRPAYS